jgi:solute:Na+ symporter, SSS family
MHRELASIDVAVVVLYLLGTMLLGLVFARRQRDMRTYFVGDRNVSWWLILFSIVATETSTVTFLSVPGLAYNPAGGNLTFLQLSFGYVIGRVLIAWLLLPLYLRGELFSAYQVLRERFDVRVQRTASAIFLLTRAVADGLRLYLAALLLQQFTDWNGDFSILVIGGATIFYTFVGGMQAVIWTDLVQFIIYVAGAVLAGILMLNFLPGGWQDYLAVGEQAGKFTLLSWSIDPTEKYTLWTGLIGGAVLTMASHGADQLMVQRYFCSRSLGQARAALIASGFVVLLQFLLFLLLGVGLYVLREKGILTGVSQARNDEVFGHFIVGYLPHGIIGIVTAAVLASAMGTLSSSLSSSSSAFVADFYKPLRPGLSEGSYFLVSKLMTLFWGIVRMAVALVCTRYFSNRSVVDQVLSVAGFTTGIILGLFLLGRLHRPVRSSAALIGLVVGFLAVLATWLPAVWGEAFVAWPWYAPIGTIVTVVVALGMEAFGIGHGSSSDRGPKSGLNQPG